MVQSRQLGAKRAKRLVTGTKVRHPPINQAHPALVRHPRQQTLALHPDQAGPSMEEREGIATGS